MKKLILLIVIILNMNFIYASDTCPINIKSKVFLAMGYGPELGFPLLGTPLLGFGLELNDIFYLYAYENIFNSLGAFGSYGFASGIRYGFINLKSTFFWGRTGGIANWNGISFYIGPQIKVHDSIELQLNFGVTHILNLNNEAHFNKLFPKMGKVNWNIEICGVMNLFN